MANHNSDHILSNELRVGIMFLTGIILLVLVFMTLTRWGREKDTYTIIIRYSQVQGIQEGAEVRVAGVKVGYVGDITLNPPSNGVELQANIRRDVKVYSHYVYTIGIGGLVGERFVDIRPVSTDQGIQVPPNGAVAGTVIPDINDVLANTNDLVGSLSVTARALNAVIGDAEAQRDLRAAITALHTTTANTAAMTARLGETLQRGSMSVDAILADLHDVSSQILDVSNTLTPQLKNTTLVSNLEKASVSVVRITDRLDGLAIAVGGLVDDPAIKLSLRGTLENLRRSSADLEAVMAQAKLASADLPQIVGNVKLASADLPLIVGNVKAASADLPQITAPFRQVSPDTAKNVLEISKELKTTSAAVSGITRRLGGISGLLGGFDMQPEARLMALAKGGSSRSDLNVDTILGKNMFRLGVTDLSQDNRVNVQLGRRLGTDGWLRYGVIESSFGVGADFDLSSKWRVNSELFNPNRPHANVLVNYHLPFLDDNLWLSGGYYNIFDDNNFGIGLTYRQE